MADEESAAREERFEQLELFTDYAALEQKRQEEEAELAREKKMQQAVLAIKKKFGITGMVFDRICRFHFFFLS